MLARLSAVCLAALLPLGCSSFEEEGVPQGVRTPLSECSFTLDNVPVEEGGEDVNGTYWDPDGGERIDFVGPLYRFERMSVFCDAKTETGMTVAIEIRMNDYGTALDTEDTFGLKVGSRVYSNNVGSSGEHLHSLTGPNRFYFDLGIGNRYGTNYSSYINVANGFWR